MTETRRRAGLATDTGLRQSFDRYSREEDISSLSHGYLTSYGGAMRIGSWSEEVTLNTGGTTTNTTNQIPANSFVRAVLTRITATFGTAVSYTVGDSTTAARFLASNSNVTAGNGAVGLAHREGGNSTDATGPTQASAAAVRITTNAQPSAGKVLVTVIYETFTPPSVTPE